MSIRSEEVNYLIYRYLQECGFDHTAFNFAYESMLSDTKVIDEQVEPGALITLLKKALCYMEIEAHVRDDNTEVECVAPFSLIHPHKCISGKREQIEESMMEEETTTKEISPSRVKAIEGHTDRIYSCHWNPVCNTVATGSADSTVRLWSVSTSCNEGESLDTTEEGILQHSQTTTEHNDILWTSWRADGRQLLTASYDGTVNLWTSENQSVVTVCKLDAPVFHADFSPSGEHILITGNLPYFYVYSNQQEVKQELDTLEWNMKVKNENSTGITIPTNSVILSSIWKNDSAFTYVDNMNSIVMLSLNPEAGKKPANIITGLINEINSIAWTCDQRVLLSASEDPVIRVWNDEKETPIFEYSSHNAEVNQVLPSHTDPSLFFSCSNDHTVKVFDIANATPLFTFSEHENPVTLISQSYGEYSKIVASASQDRSVYLFDSTSNELIRSYKANNPIYDMSFNYIGDKLSLATMDSQLYLLDIRV